jgi:hypothetical protein
MYGVKIKAKVGKKSIDSKQRHFASFNRLYDDISLQKGRIFTKSSLH